LSLSSNPCTDKFLSAICVLVKGNFESFGAEDQIGDYGEENRGECHIFAQIYAGLEIGGNGNLDLVGGIWFYSSRYVVCREVAFLIDL
jgi:hypothetical protein